MNQLILAANGAVTSANAQYLPSSHGVQGHTTSSGTYVQPANHGD